MMRRSAFNLISVLFVLFSRNQAYSQADTSDATNDSLMIAKSANGLRVNMKYKFAFDFAIRQGISFQLKDYNGTGFDTLERTDPRVLEEFVCFNYYRLYECKSFDGIRSYFLLQKGNEFPLSLYLFRGDSIHATLVDSFQCSRQATFAFDTLNGGNIFRIEEWITGSGFYGHPLELVTINNDRFVELFHCYLSYVDAMMGDTVRRGTGKLRFVDLNHDGWLDILLESSEDMLDPHETINPWIEGELENAKPLTNLSHRVEKFIWDKQSLRFKRQE